MSFVFKECILKLLKDFDMVPIVLQEKDAFIYFSLLIQVDGDGVIHFDLDTLLRLFQIIANYYIKDFDEGNDCFSQLDDQNVKILIKRIELS